MSDRIDLGAEPWQAIPRRVLRDGRLTARAKGGLVTLLSHEEGWVRSSVGILQRECNIGRKQAQTIMAELVSLGYAQLVHSHQGNLVKTSYEVFATPIGATSPLGSMPSLSYRERAGHVPDPARQRSAVVEALDVDPQEEEPKDLEPKAAHAVDANPNQPTHDQMHLARRLSEDWGQDLTPAAIVKLNQAHGRGNVENAMRSLRGFPPEEAVRKLYAYVAQIAEDNAAVAS